MAVTCTIPIYMWTNDDNDISILSYCKEQELSVKTNCIDKSIVFLHRKQMTKHYEQISKVILNYIVWKLIMRIKYDEKLCT